MVFLIAAFASHNSPEALEARVAAVGSLNISGENAGASDSSAPQDGEAVYNTTCAVCHGAGLSGAPVLGEIDDWEDRIEEGMDTLVKRAIRGYSGNSGVMPPKGGNASLSDNAVTAAVQFMVDKVE